MRPTPFLPLASNHFNLMENRTEFAVLVRLPSKCPHKLHARHIPKSMASCLWGIQPSIFQRNAVCAASSEADQLPSKIEFCPGLPNEPISDSIRKSWNVLVAEEGTLNKQYDSGWCLDLIPGRDFNISVSPLVKLWPTSPKNPSRNLSQM